MEDFGTSDRALKFLGSMIFQTPSYGLEEGRIRILNLDVRNLYFKDLQA